MLRKNGTITDSKSITNFKCASLIEGQLICVYSLLALNKTESWKTKKRNGLDESKFF